MKFSPGVVRLIARLDVKGPNLIKGIQFDGHRVLGVPEYFADMYYKEGIDEFIFQDSVASLYCRKLPLLHPYFLIITLPPCVEQQRTAKTVLTGVL